MPALKAKTFSIPISSPPVENDVILIANSVDHVYTAQNLSNGWAITSSQEVSFSSAPVYANGVVTFAVSYFGDVVPTKACFVPGPNR